MDPVMVISTDETPPGRHSIQDAVLDAVFMT